MRLDFTILWIDDQPKHVNSFSDGLRLKLLDQGFDLRVTPVAKLSEVPEKIATHVHDDMIDLVMVDYDLGHNAKTGGEEAIKMIREKFPFKEVLFYSATDRDSLRKVAFDAKVDGIHFSTRLSLVDDAMHVIKKLIGKVVDIDHMRGIVMSASSDIDYMVQESLVAVYGRLREEEQKEFCSMLIERIDEKIKKWQLELGAASGESKFESLLALKHLFTANDKLTCLRDQLNKGGWASGQHNHHVEKLKAYQVEVVPTRNKLAHAMLRRQEGKRPELVGTKGSWDVEEMTKLRQSFIDHRENLQTIATLVDAALT